jgi:hypothetical protein
MALLKPGLTLSLVVNTDNIRWVNDIRTSTIHDISGKEIIIAQTDPCLLTSQLNKSIVVSFLTHEKGDPTRYGFRARIAEFLNDYRLSSSQTVPAVVLEQNTIPRLYNLRMFYRLQPPSRAGLYLSIFEQPVSVIDISLGGALVGVTADQDRFFRFEPGNIIKMTLTIDGETYELEARIQRISSQENPRRDKKLVIIACQFSDRPSNFDQVLGRKILDIQRELRSKGFEP